MQRIKRNKSLWSIIGGFVLLFLLYHIPEFLQHHFNSPLLWLFELMMLALLITSYFIGSWQKGKGLSTFGLENFNTNKFNLIKGLGFGFLLAVLSNFITIWLGWNNLEMNSSPGQIALNTLVFALGTFLPSLAEDLLTRGYVFAHWPAKWDKKLLVLVSAFIFSLNHIYRLNQPDVMLYIFLLGILLMVCLVYTRSLWLTLGIHWGANLAYQFFNNVFTLKKVKDTGLDNYVLAICFFLGIFIIVALLKRKYFQMEEG